MVNQIFRFFKLGILYTVITGLALALFNAFLSFEAVFADPAGNMIPIILLVIGGHIFTGYLIVELNKRVK